jgi:S-(hydroxymethyl)glutathione dehydrogenase/alcohol dehydrogenase
MRAAVLHRPGEPLAIEELEPVGIGPREVLVRVTACGICHSDLGPIEGWREVPLPIVLGHEAAGFVEEVGARVYGLNVGDRVVTSFVLPCGECAWCKRGEGHLCREGRPLTQTPRLRRADGTFATPFCGLGAFAEMVVADERSLVRVDCDLPDEQLALLGCAVTTGVFAVLNSAAVHAGDTVAVVGCGGVGQAIVQAARLVGASRIIAIDPIAMKRSSALQSGASDALDPTVEDAIARVMDLTGGVGVDYAFDATGHTTAIHDSFGMTRRGGRTTLVGIPRPGEAVPWTLAEHFYEAKTVTGCIFGAANLVRDLPRLIALVEAGLFDLAPLVSERVSLGDINDGVAALREGNVIRTVIVPDAG